MNWMTGCSEREIKPGSQTLTRNCETGHSYEKETDKTKMTFATKDSPRDD